MKMVVERESKRKKEEEAFVTEF